MSWHTPPGIEKPQRFRPKFHYELLVCGLRGHALVGRDVATVRPEDRVVVHDEDGLRWHRCLRCDSWLPLPLPQAPKEEHLPNRDQILVPLRGRALRDKIVLRLIAADRAFHTVILTLLAVAVFLFAANEPALRDTFYRLVAQLEGPVSAASPNGHGGLVGELYRLFDVKQSTLKLIGVGFVIYAAISAAEAVGLWLMKRWAEYLTFISMTALIPLEVYELVHKLSPFKVVAILLNVLIVIYLLTAKRLFGVRGGAQAEREERERGSGWEGLQETFPPHLIQDKSHH